MHFSATWPDLLNQILSGFVCLARTADNEADEQEVAVGAPPSPRTRAREHVNGSVLAGGLSSLNKEWDEQQGDLQ